MIENYVDLYGMLSALKDRISSELWMGVRAELALTHIAQMKDRAIAYIWGREDEARNKIREAYGRELIDAAWEFGHMVAIMVAMSYLECGQRWPQTPNIRDTYAAFRAGTDLRDYVDSPWPR
jgi:hypothetical protein